MEAESKMLEGTKQKYTLVYMGDVTLNYEIFDYKRDLRKKLRTLEQSDVKVIMKGRLLPTKVEERLTI